jgi:hypothetical protein
MTPLETIGAAANRLQQEADGCGNHLLRVRLREISATVRGALATIRNQIDPLPEGKKKTVRKRLIAGDEENG